MKHWMYRAAVLTATLVLAATLFTACGADDPVVIYDSTTTTTDTEATEPTVAIPEGRLGLSKLMALMGPDMAWSDLSEYEYTAVSDTEASFLVQNNNGQTCTLTVVYNAADDTISQATLISGDVTLDALSGDTATVRKILVAMNQQDAQPDGEQAE